MNIILFGPQGSGKGTQAELLARNHRLVYISTGDIFRYHLKHNTELGAQVQSYVNVGALVPDELTNQIVKDRLLQPDCVGGFVLDGYPRNKKQAEFLTGIATIDAAVVIELSDEVAIERLANRLACKCGLSYHTVYNPPKRVGICDKCGNELYRRDDDQPEAIKKRLAIYHQETEAIFALYEAQGILHRVNGNQGINLVYQDIETALGVIT